ncbi:EF-P lysine aminoacylase EpmA [Lichenibacterium dinghuense]|uniref:EF-P lysine aminoacylase EpmA n=1 Tax=Lichenibacterium dinghuense TaxID=2895977 RepID=UPI001EECFE50|nr:EF-P lysine aminoacylase EpmA [Lichenibacterium sp. 6Y81]
MPASASPSWSPHVYADRRPFLLARARIAAALRRWFEARGFLEVETPILQRSPGNEAHLEAFATELVGPDGASHRLYLHTSPEFAMKKLLAAGEPRLVTLARVFRNRERSATHHPEFTMLEWYRAGAPYADLMDDCAALLAAAAEAAGSRHWSHRGRSCDPFAEPERVSVADAFARHAGVDLLATLGRAEPDRDALVRQAEAAGVPCAADDSWSDAFSRLLSARVEPHLGIGRPTVLDRYPAPEAALARPCADDPRAAERFELYCCGVELANGFGELTDAAEQRRRFEAAMAGRAARGQDSYPLDEDFLDALAIMPEASGIALGFDRLVMLAAGAPAVEQVMALPVARG